MTNLGLEVNYVRKSGGDYGAWQDIAGQYVQVPYIDNVGIDATGQTVMVYRLLSNPGDRVFLQTNPDGMYMRYNGATFALTKRMSQNWQGVVSLVLSKAEGRLASSARFTPRTSQSSLATAGGQFGRDDRRTERLRQHRRPADRRPSGGRKGAAHVPVPVGHPGRCRATCSTRPAASIRAACA